MGEGEGVDVSADRTTPGAQTAVQLRRQSRTVDQSDQLGVQVLTGRVHLSFKRYVFHDGASNKDKMTTKENMSTGLSAIFKKLAAL